MPKGLALANADTDRAPGGANPMKAYSGEGAAAIGGILKPLSAFVL